VPKVSTVVHLQDLSAIFNFSVNVYTHIINHECKQNVMDGED